VFFAQTLDQPPPMQRRKRPQHRLWRPSRANAGHAFRQVEQVPSAPVRVNRSVRRSPPLSFSWRAQPGRQPIHRSIFQDDTRGSLRERVTTSGATHRPGVLWDRSSKTALKGLALECASHLRWRLGNQVHSPRHAVVQRTLWSARSQDTAWQTDRTREPRPAGRLGCRSR